MAKSPIAHSLQQPAAAAARGAPPSRSRQTVTRSYPFPSESVTSTWRTVTSPPCAASISMEVASGGDLPGGRLVQPSAGRSGATGCTLRCERRTAVPSWSISMPLSATAEVVYACAAAIS